MSEPMIGEIQIFANTSAPTGWLKCDGRAVPIALYRDLDTLLDGRFGRSDLNFNLPNLSDRLPGGAGQGPDRSSRAVGDAYGDADVQFKAAHLPPHSHSMVSFATRETEGLRGVPNPGDRLSLPALAFGYSAHAELLDTSLAPDALDQAGGNVPRENRQPYLAVSFYIATAGDYPQFA